MAKSSEFLSEFLSYIQTEFQNTIRTYVLGIVSKGLFCILCNQLGIIAITIQVHIYRSLNYRFDIITKYETVSLDVYNTALKQTSSELTLFPSNLTCF
jgi:hypothetical protein